MTENRTFQLALKVPVVSAPMFLVSGPELVVASAAAGIIGAMPAYNARTTEQLDEWIGDIATKIAAARIGKTGPFGTYAINLIAHSSNPRLLPDLDIVVKHRVPIVFSSVGDPSRIREAVHSYGGKVFSDVATVRHAARAADTGIDGLVLLCAGAGGNCGWLSPFAFVPEVRQFWNGPLAVAGAIGSGRAARASIELGADLCYIGTRFIATKESMANSAYREMLVESGADDVSLTTEVTGIPANFLAESLKRCRFRPDGAREITGFNTAKEIAVFKKWKDIWSAGQAVGAIRAVTSVADLVDEFANEFHRRSGQTADSPLQLAI